MFILKVSSKVLLGVLLCIIISIYFLNNNPTSYFFAYTRYFNLMVAVFIFLCVIFSIFNNSNNVVRFSYFEWFAIIGMISTVIMTLFARGYLNFHWIYLLFSLVFLSGNKQLTFAGTIPYIRFLLLAGALITFYWLFTTRFYDDRPVTNWYDPNYSGFYIFVLFLFLWYSNLKLFSVLVLASGFLLLSRSYYLSVLIFFMLLNLRFVREVFFSLKLNRFLVVASLGLLILIPIERYFANQETRLASMEEKSILVVEDASNQDRFTANVLFKKDFIENFSDYQFGMHIEEYTTKVFRNTPHNAFYALIINYGFYFTLFYLILFAKAYDRFFTRENFPIIISLFPYYLLLGAGIQGLPGLLVFYLLAINKSRV